MKRLALLIIVFSFLSFAEANYIKSYYPNGTLKEEGWMLNQKKCNYWFFYFENGSKKQEGHFKNDKRSNWWIFYNVDGEVVKKCQYKNNKLNGFVINYEDGKIKSAEKCSNGKRIKYWNSLSEFKKDNPYLF